MRIILYLSSSGWMENAFCGALQLADVEVLPFFYSNVYSRVRFNKIENDEVERINLSFLSFVNYHASIKEIDLIFFCACDDFILPSTLKDLRRLSIPLVNYHPDMGYLWFRILRTGNLFDLVACAQSSHISALKREGISAYFIPFGSNPQSPISFQVSSMYNGVRYLGSPFPDRAMILGRLYAKGIPIEVYGHHWFWYPRKGVNPVYPKVIKKGFSFPFLGPSLLYNFYYYLWPRLKEEPEMIVQLAKLKFLKYIYKKSLDVETFYGNIPSEYILGEYECEDFSKMVRSAAINVGFSHLHSFNEVSKPDWQMRLRDIEVPMEGGFYLAEYSPDILSCFDAGKHIDIWRCEEELADKAFWYLSNTSVSKKIALSGMMHARENHTWIQRFRQIFVLLGLKSSI